jgi:hypothetical protein
MKKSTLILLVYLCSLSFAKAQIAIIPQENLDFAVDDSCTGQPEICFTIEDPEASDSTTYSIEILVDINGDWTYDYVINSENDPLDDNYGTPQNELYIKDATIGQHSCFTIPERVYGSRNIHRLIIRVEQKSDGEFNARTIEFMISDQTPAITNSLTSSSVTFGSNVVLSACDYILDSEDNCSQAFSYTFYGPEHGYEFPENTPGWTQDIRCEMKEFTYDEVCDENPLSVPIYTWDESNNYTITETSILFQNIDCIGDIMTTIEGSIILGAGQEMNSGEVIYNLPAPEYPYSEEIQPDGSFLHIFYGFAEYPYSLAPYNNNNPKQGVTTLDMTLIANHIDGTSQFTNPYQYIAADVNNDGMIDQSDVDEVEQLISNQIDTFANNTSWRFHSAVAELNISNPYAIVETVFDTIDHWDMVNNFIGIKIGDVNGTYENLTSSTEQYTTQSEFNVIVQSSNPFEDILSFMIQTDIPQEINLDIYSQTGQQVISRKINLYDSQVSVHIKSSDLPNNGTYYCRFTQGLESITKQIILLN